VDIEDLQCAESALVREALGETIRDPVTRTVLPRGSAASTARRDHRLRGYGCDRSSAVLLHKPLLDAPIRRHSCSSDIDVGACDHHADTGSGCRS
jgi:hypothetical protein